MKTKRVFLAIPCEPVDLVFERRQQLQSLLPDYRIRWVGKESLHLTLFFFGNISTQQVSAIQDAFFVAKDRLQSFSFTINSPGIFSSGNEPRVIWLGVETSDKLTAIKSSIDQTVASIGFFNNNHPFVPHITLGRFASHQAITPQLTEAIDNEKEMKAITFSARSVILYESVLSPDGSQYKPIEIFRLQDPFLLEKQ